MTVRSANLQSADILEPMSLYRKAFHAARNVQLGKTILYGNCRTFYSAHLGGNLPHICKFPDEKRLTVVLNPVEASRNICTKYFSGFSSIQQVLENKDVSVTSSCSSRHISLCSSIWLVVFRSLVNEITISAALYTQMIYHGSIIGLK